MRGNAGIFEDTQPAVIELQTRQPASTQQGEMASTNRIPPVADLNLTVSNPPTQAEVQSIADKVDEFLAAARQAGHLAP